MSFSVYPTWIPSSFSSPSESIPPSLSSDVSTPTDPVPPHAAAAVALLVAVTTATAAASGVYCRVYKRPKKVVSSVHDPFYSSALQRNSAFPFKEGKDGSDQAEKLSYDGVINSCARFESVVPPREAIIKVFQEHVIPHQQFWGIPDTGAGGKHLVYRAPSSYSSSSSSNRGSDTGHQNQNHPPIDVDKHFIELTSSGKEETLSILEAVMNDNTSIREEGAETPWWRVRLVREPSGCGAMIFSSHHCLADGMSLMRVFSSILTDAEGNPITMASPPKRRNYQTNPQRQIKGGLCGALWSHTKKSFSQAADFSICTLQTLMNGCGAHDTPSPFIPGGKISWPLTTEAEKKRVIVICPRHSLQLIKDIKNKLGGGTTINDVEFSLYAGMMARYLRQYAGWSQEQLDVARFRALTPFVIPHTVKNPEERYTHTCTNTFTLIVNKFPVAERTARDRVKASHETWLEMKTRAYVPASIIVAKAAAHLLSLPAQQQCMLDMFSRMSCLFSNVPGPAADVYVCGSRVTELVTSFPNLTPNVIAVSYNGEIHFTLTMAQMGEPGMDSDCRIALPKLFQAELDELRAQLDL